MKQPLIHLVADYGVGDPAFSEVMQRLHAKIPGCTVIPTSVPPLDTLTTGLWIFQYALGEHPDGMVIYSNTAPRKDDKSKRANNAGEHLMYAKLKNGVEIVAVNSGYCFSFVKPHIESFKIINVENKGSQFRSRDFYPRAVAEIIEKHEDILGEEVGTTDIPAVPANEVAWIDGYGNMKTTITKSNVAFDPGSKVRVTINGTRRTALIAGGNFSVNEGELSFSPGSSGHDDPFMELFLRGGSAHDLFNHPTPGAKVKIEAL